MSVRVSSWVWDFSDTTGSDRLVLLAIADEADDDGTNAYPGIARLARKSRIPQRTVMRCLGRLEAIGELSITRPTKPGRGQFNRYRVVMSEGDNVAPSAGGESPRIGATSPRKGDTQPSLTSGNGEYPGPRTQDPNDFSRFWAVYPLRKSKADAEKAWPKALKAAGDVETILAAAQRYVAECNATGTILAYPATWLNKRRWEDEPSQPPTGYGFGIPKPDPYESRPRPTDFAPIEGRNDPTVNGAGVKAARAALPGGQA